ncbi:MFS transporter [Cronbergia sp. UHCC 0137]|uniref:MFS transporter n=1 Tax=Cronbergia sp. UHCC 0137 TaxID=3110239 RepID=UPI002B203B53|nr:MFS transporter [Cronbergia sp. UHCC 0137]MEA5617975.1 MFS transporter [Cronbergia sp. UHCC 0137]
MTTFILIWFGQVLSLVGSRTTSFALSIWVYQHTNSITQFTLLILSTTLPGILISPIAGVFVDRWSRRWIMIISDFCAGLCTLTIAWLFVSGNLQVWNLCLFSAISSSCNAFQTLAYSSATTLLVPKEQLGRASSMTQIRLAIAEILSPALAATLLVTVQIPGIVVIDLTTLVFALICLLLVKFPEIQTTKAQGEEIGFFSSFWQEITFGWHYFIARPGLIGLVAFVAISNFLIGGAEALTTPLVLSFASTQALGTISSIASSGMLISSLIMSLWGGIERQMNIIFTSMFFFGFFYVLAGLLPSPILFTISDFFIFFILPIVNGAIQVIYQKKVAPEVQGKVFAFRIAVTQGFLPLSYLIAGPLADQIFEPLMAADGLGATNIGQIIGVGTGRGIGLIFVIMGIFSIIFTFIAYLYPRLRLLEDELPDSK